MNHRIITLILIVFLILPACGKNPAGLIIISSIPMAPLHVHAEYVDKDLIKVSWDDNSMNEEGFRVSRGSTKFGWADIAEVTQSTQVYMDTLRIQEDFQMMNEGRVSYLVCAHNTLGASEFALSNEVPINQ